MTVRSFGAPHEGQCVLARSITNIALQPLIRSSLQKRSSFAISLSKLILSFGIKICAPVAAFDEGLRGGQCAFDFWEVS